MKQGVKIVTIGGGSSYTPELIEGILNRYHELPVTELWLVDIEPGKEKLEIIGNLAKRMIMKSGFPIEVHLAIDKRVALEGADFIITQFRVGLLEARARDENIPLRHGVLGQETNGPGGLFKGLRTIPVMLDLVKDIKELCPEAWLINFTNPVGMVTESVFRCSDYKNVVGLCNVPIGMEKGIAKLLKVDHSRIRMDFVGINHMVYGVDVYLDGVSVKEKVIDLLSHTKKYAFIKNVEGQESRKLSAIPCPYQMYYEKKDEVLQEEMKNYQEGRTRAAVVKKLETELFDLYKSPTLAIKPPQIEQRGGAYYSEAAVRLISSIYNDKGDIQPVNTLNKGAIASLPSNSTVEVSCVITKNGPKAIIHGDIPSAVRGLVQQLKRFEGMSVEAAVTGSYDTALLAMTENPLVPSNKVGKRILDEMLEAHKEHLPNFYKKVGT
ncbi:6-phospho-beta-glucosidase [Bacillus sp. FJAT-44742]|uniref:6-phospho-beta-glucosidase n=1 Tax=Bacillus sp. FJAT-44742 TaxID=2014005 RepID=UPI000C2484BC|nr:6-phospho-beta-glucosidase [Bacillus sp. FJAT-44742]